MAKTTEVQLEEYDQMLVDLRRRDAEHEYIALSKLGVKFGRTSISRRSLVRYNRELGYRHFETDEALSACIERFIEASRRRVIEKRRKSNTNAFSISRVRKRYAEEHQFDHGIDPNQLGLTRRASYRWQ